MARAIADIDKPAHPARTENGTSLKDHTLENVEIALRVLAANGTRFKDASAQLETEYKIEVHPQTLMNWVNNLFPKRYLNIQQDVMGQIEEGLTTTTTVLAARAAQAQEKALSLAEDRLDSPDAEDIPFAQLAKGAKDLAQTSDVSLKQSRLLQDKSTEIAGKETPDELLERLARLNLVSKDEVIDAEVVPNDSKNEESDS